MSNSSKSGKDMVRRNAMNHFAKLDKRDTLLRKEREKADSDAAAKTAKLRALRLAKEAADRELAAK